MFLTKEDIDKIKLLPIGTILIIDHPNFSKKSPKFIVLLIKDYKEGTLDEIHCMTINSNIPNLHKKSEKRKNHILIKQQDYSFLKYDSYIDCTQIKSAFVKEIFRKESWIRGRITKETKDQILEKINYADDIEDKIRKRIISGLINIT
jgi:hypothetical protein